MKRIEFTFLLPCLNEELTIKDTILEIKEFIKKNKLSSEILVIDNGSNDNSVNICNELGVKVVFESKKGYGNALRRGFNEAKGKYIIMGDSDTTYDFRNCDLFVKYLRDGYDFVLGNRLCFKYKNKEFNKLNYYGVMFLSLVGRLKYKNKLNDYHCGLRGVNSQFIKGLDFKCTGMEFATEMIKIISLNTDKIVEVPTRLRSGNVERKPKLRKFRDGFRHLFYILFDIIYLR